MSLSTVLAAITWPNVTSGSISPIGPNDPLRAQIIGYITALYNGSPTYGVQILENATAAGTEAIFSNPSAMPQMMITCVRATRHVFVAKTATVAAPFMAVWTSSMTRSIPSSFNPLTRRLSVDLATYDPLLDALAFSRGRIGVGVAGAPQLVVPAQPEVARVVEDCRG